MTETPDFIIFLGRFHPLVVHMPIGFLFFAFLLEIYSKWKKDSVFNAGIPLALLTGAVTAAIACILGYMLSLSGGYDDAAIDSHFWFGIATTVIAFMAWLIRIDKIKISKLNSVKSNIATLALLVILLSVTGHYGGNLTHGSDYLTKYAPFQEKEEPLQPVTKVEDAVVYSYLVAPILENKCTSCHNTDKKKGGLMLHDSIAILGGGKNGAVLVAGDASKSELIRRVLLNPHHDDFMPPKGKTPLTEEETAIITYWIDNANASFSTKIGAIESSKKTLAIATTMLGLSSDGNNGNELPKLGVIDEKVLNELLSEGFTLRELVFGSNLYEAVLPSNTITVANADLLEEKLKKLVGIKDHILWLSIQDNNLSDANIKDINQFKNLLKLKLNSNPITDIGISELNALSKLTSINLYNTQVTEVSLGSLSKLKNLQKIYAWETKITAENSKPFLKKGAFQVVLGKTID
ncbi:c-type cytochrome domain-containing protein [Polaribacter sp. Q13]|uniref:c-type cytochrome domain-containing protein n=1 Tax=Polaribacter sp. Q13 TaxID=2806551 RepID=UPI00193BF7CD|nr:c-type cytochrome domain-containing protein [Polaribacter sp. Q13]QVY66027.1 hypothetical protein JOP69_01655 [Polaribacter sp. Q13]